MIIIREARFEDMRQIISGVDNVWPLVLGMVLFTVFMSLSFRNMTESWDFGTPSSKRKKQKRLAYIYTAIGILAMTTAVAHSYILPALDTDGYYLARIESIREFDTNAYEIVDVAPGDNYWIKELDNQHDEELTLIQPHGLIFH